jgi:hypothetical protein
LFQAITKKKEGRYGISDGVFDWQIVTNMARDAFPQLVEKGIIPIGKPDDKPSEKGTYLLDQSKAERELDQKGGGFHQDIAS